MLQICTALGEGLWTMDSYSDYSLMSRPELQFKLKLPTILLKDTAGLGKQQR